MILNVPKNQMGFVSKMVNRALTNINHARAEKGLEPLEVTTTEPGTGGMSFLKAGGIVLAGGIAIGLLVNMIKK